MMAVPGAPDAHEDEDQIDGCTCNLEFNESNALSDAELPAVAGGVQAAAEQHDGEDGIDGCDLDFSDLDATADDELPPAAGGVVEKVP